MNNFKETFNNYYNYFLSNHIDDLIISYMPRDNDRRKLKQEIINEDWGTRSDTDVAMDNAVDKTAQDIVKDFYSLGWTEKWSSFHDYYNCKVNGSSSDSTPMREYVCKINNEWINEFNVYIDVTPERGKHDDSIFMEDNILYKYSIDMKYPRLHKKAYKFSERKQKIEYASCIIISVDWMTSVNGNDMIFQSIKNKLKENIKGTILHELKHAYDIYKRDITYDVYAPEQVYIQLNYKDFLDTFLFKQDNNNIYNSIFDLHGTKALVTIIEYDMLKFIILNDMFYTGTYAEAGANLENFKTDMDDKSMQKLFKMVYTQVDYELTQDYISYVSPVYRNFLLCAKVVSMMRKYVPDLLKKQFSDEFYDDFREIYKKDLKSISKDEFFDWLCDMFYDNQIYFLRNAGARVIDKLSVIATKKQLEHIEEMLKEIVKNHYKES